MEIAAAGGHNIILIGPPGAGKTMLAKRLPSILPPMSLQEALETTKIHSVMGKVKNQGLISVLPFRSPHHTISDVALVGGGAYPQPGEISLAHNGVLFLDELPEFKRGALEVMRQPLEDREVTIARAKFTVTYPASFMLVASMNPSPSGYFTDPHSKLGPSPMEMQRYMGKISGPLLDRIDLHIEVEPVPFERLANRKPAEITATQKLEVLQVLAENTPNDGSETVIVDLENTGGGHYIRIKAADNIFFNLNEGPFRVVAPEPLPNTVLSLSLDPHFTPEYVTLNWNDPFTNELRWYIERSENGNQNFVLIDSVDANIITYNDSNVDVNNGHYVYRVYAKNLVSTSVLSNEAELNLMSINEGPEISEIQVYPNPSSGLIEISGDQKWDEIQVFDSEGRFIRMVDKTLSKVVDLSDLSNGAYLLTLKAEGYSIKRQVVIFNQ